MKVTKIILFIFVVPLVVITPAHTEELLRVVNRPEIIMPIIGIIFIIITMGLRLVFIENWGIKPVIATAILSALIALVSAIATTNLIAIIAATLAAMSARSIALSEEDAYADNLTIKTCVYQGIATMGGVYIALMFIALYAAW